MRFGSIPEGINKIDVLGPGTHDEAVAVATLYASAMPSPRVHWQHPTRNLGGQSHPRNPDMAEPSSVVEERGFASRSSSDILPIPTSTPPVNNHII